MKKDLEKQIVENMQAMIEIPSVTGRANECKKVLDLATEILG